MALLKSLLMAALLPLLAKSQFVPAPADLISTTGYLDLPVRYKEVPDGICELTPGVKSYSGYVDIDENQHIFWWFFEARNEDPATAPLTAWVNGGPGSSSMIGLFQEIGPCGVDAEGELYYNEYAWNNVSNMLFIDQPAQVGFSYSTPIPGYTGNGGGSLVELPSDECPKYAEDCGTYSYPSPIDTANTTINAAPGMYKTLQGFLGAAPFKKYARNGFNFATESYGGHYAPVFNEYIVQQNMAIDAGELQGAHKIDLETVMIGNGWYDPLLQYGGYYNYTVDNPYDVRLKREWQVDEMFNAMYGEGNCGDMTKDCYETKSNDVCAAADNFCYAEVEYLWDVYTKRSEYDIRELAPDPFPYAYYVDYLNTPKVQQAIGAYVNFTESSDTVGSAAFGNTGDDDRTQGSVQACRDLIAQGIYLVQFNGDADYICNWIGNEAVVDLIDAPGMSTAGYTNMSTSDDIVHGQVKQSANFAWARIYEAGHEVPFYQPLASLELFNRTLHHLDIATGETAITPDCEYKTSGTPKSKYQEGNATVQFVVLLANSTYNTTTNMPNPPMNGTSSGGDRKRVKRSSEVKKVLSRRGAFMPPGMEREKKRSAVGRRTGMMPWPRR